jgi:hypothetical protein
MRQNNRSQLNLRKILLAWALVILVMCLLSCVILGFIVLV